MTSEEFTGFWRGFGKRSLEIAGVSLFGMGVRTPWTTQMYLKESQQTWEGIKAGAELFTTAWDASWGDASAELRRQEMVGAIVNNFATMSPEEWGSMAPDVLLGVGTGGAGAGRAVLGTGARALGTVRRMTVLGRSGKALNLDTSILRSLVRAPRSNSVLRQIRSDVRGEKLVVTERAVGEMTRQVENYPLNLRESIRWQYTRGRAQLVADNPTERFNVPVTNQLRENDLIIFGTGDRIGATTLTQDAKFVKAFQNKYNVALDVRVYPPIKY